MTGGRVAGAGIQAATLVVVARGVGPSDFGKLAIVLSIVAVAQTVSDLGIASFLSVERAHSPESPSLHVALRVNAVTSLALAAIIALTTVALGAFVSDLYFLMTPLALWASSERNADTRLMIAIADGDVWINTVNLVARRSSALILLVLLDTLLDISMVLTYSVAVAVAAVGSSMFAYMAIRSRVVNLGGPAFRVVISESRPFWTHSVATQARNLDVVVVGAVGSAAASGFYAAARRLSTPLLLLPSSLASLLLPAIARSTASRTERTRVLRVAVVLAGAMSVVYAALWVLAPWGVDKLLGESFRPATGAIQWVLVGLPFAAGSSSMNAILQGSGQKSQAAKVSILVVPISLLAAAGGTLVGGATGAGAGFALSMAAQASILGALLRFGSQAHDGP